MNLIYSFYNIFSFQELILKFNNLNENQLVTLNKCILFKPQVKESENTLDNLNNDLRYIFEFLTESVVIKSINPKYHCISFVNINQSQKLLLYLSYLVFTKSQLLLENSKFESNFPVIQKKKRKNVTLYDNKKSYFDIKFNNGVDLAFLSDNEYVSYLAVEFYIRFLFKKIEKISFLYQRQLIYLSLVGSKFCLILKK